MAVYVSVYANSLEWIIISQVKQIYTYVYVGYIAGINVIFMFE